MNKKKMESKIIKYIKLGFIIFNVLLILITISSAAASQTPYSGTALKVPGIIQAEDFDNGGEGIAYHDSDTKNNGGAYRTGEGIDIEQTTDSGLGYDIGWIKAGEWMEYTTNITSLGTYDIEVRVARGGTGGKFHIEFNGLDKTGTLTIPNTGGWQNWTTIKKTGVSLSKGTQFMKIVFDTNSPTGEDAGNINYVKIVPTPTPTAPANIINNPGFEIGSTTPAKWSYITNNGNTPVWESTTAHTGAKSVKISVSGTTDVISGELLYDNIPSTSGTTYMLSAWGKSQGIGGINNPAVRVAEFNINNIFLRQTSLYFPKGTADWNKLQTTFTTGAGTDYIKVYANIWNGFGTFYVDDISLTTVTPTVTPTVIPTVTPTVTPTPAPTPTTPTPIRQCLLCGKKR